MCIIEVVDQVVCGQCQVLVVVGYVQLFIVDEFVEMFFGYYQIWKVGIVMVDYQIFMIGLCVVQLGEDLLWILVQVFVIEVIGVY